MPPPPSPRPDLLAPPVAVVGMGCRFPGAATPAALWRLLMDGRDAIGELQPRWRSLGLEHLVNAATAMRYAGLVDQVDQFDHAFFGVSAREAARMDPQQRLLLEVTWEALENAGVVAQDLLGSRTGVFVGISSHDYELLALAQGQHADGHTLSGNAMAFVAARVSYVLGLQGPSVGVDTACASSLTAVHLALQALQAGECDMALACGVNLLVSPFKLESLRQTGVLAMDGRCKTFDARADGYVRSEGLGVLVLKPLAAAQRHGDRVHGLIVASAVNQDGASTGLTTPRVSAQVAVLREALQHGQLQPSDVGYVEAHGTGTPWGDAVEAQALREVFGGPRPDGSVLPVASVKTNLGHCEAAAGMAGLIKSLLAVQHGALPAQVHFTALHPHIDWRGTQLVVPQKAMPWPAGTTPRRAGVSAFAMSGSNAHVIVQQAPEIAPRQTPRDSRSHLLCLSARSEAALQTAVRDMLMHLQHVDVGDAAPSDIAYAAAVRRSHHPVRAAVVGRDVAAWIHGLQAMQARKAHPAVVPPPDSPNLLPHAPVWVFSGHGSQWLGMGRELLQDEPLFAEAVQACAAALRPYMPIDLLHMLQHGTEPLTAVELVQPLIFMVQVGLAALWRAWGVEPAAVVGHSMGEVAAAYAAGSLTLADAARVMALRSQLVARVAGKGGMLAVDMSAEQALERVQAFDDLHVAVINAPNAVVLSGSVEAIETLEAQLQASQQFCSRVHTDVAFHSPHMQALCDELAQGLAGILPTMPRVPLYSSVTGALCDTLQTPDYWVRNLRMPVQFARATEALRTAGHDAFIEISPHPVLAVPMLATTQALVLCSLRRDQPERGTLLIQVGTLHAHGYTVDFTKQYLHPGSWHDLPTYPWQGTRHWLPEQHRSSWNRAASTHPLLGPGVTLADGTRAWEQSLHMDRVPYLGDHRVGDAVVLPETAYVEMFLAAGRSLWDAGQLRLEELTVGDTVPLQANNAPLLQVVLRPDAGERAALCEINLKIETGWQLLASARVVVHNDGAVTMSRDDTDGEMIEASSMYAAFAAQDMAFGPSFQVLQDAKVGTHIAQARLHMRVASEGYTLHPTLLSGALQTCGLLTMAQGGAYTLVGVQELRVLADTRVVRYVRARSYPESNAALWCGEVHLCNVQGAVVVWLRGVRLRRLATRSVREPFADLLLHETWDRLPPVASGPKINSERWLLLADHGGFAVAVQKLLVAAGAHVTLVPPGGDLRAALMAQRGLQHVVHFGSLDIAALRDSNFNQVVERGCSSVLHTVQALQRTMGHDLPHMWVVTAGAVRAGDEHVDAAPEQAPVWGMMRSLACELETLRCSCVDLGFDADPMARARMVTRLADTLLCGEREDAWALRGSARYAARLRRGMGPVPVVKVPAQSRMFRIDFATPGRLDALGAMEMRRPVLGADDVEIEVHAAGVNFVDVLMVLGDMPRDFGGSLRHLGSECAGTVLRVGSAVRHVQVGQKVVAFCPNAMATDVVAPGHCVAPYPDTMPAANAAGLPVVHMTAYHALAQVAQLRAGERVLIHSAASGVGLAAVQWAQHVGAEVFATVGTAEKRAYLESLGLKHISDSRSLRFVDDVMQWTHGEGVDVVLNALSGDAVGRSLGLLRDYGRFVEIGKRDYLAQGHLAMRPFLRNLSFRLVDLITMLRHRPQQVGALLHEVMQWVQRGVLRPLPTQVFAVGDVEQAFFHMRQGLHMGKVVLDFGQKTRVPIGLLPHAVTCRSDSTYLISGGTGSLGLKLADWLLARGAGHVVVCSRRGLNPEQARDNLTRVPGRGEVWFSPADMSQPAAVAQVLERIAGTLPPLRGVIHAAGVRDETPVATLAPERLHEVMAVKVRGAWALHTQTAKLPLDFFVLYSSATAMLGAPRHGADAAANAYLDALAQWRHAQGLPGLSVNWGPFAATYQAGVQAISAEEGHAVLGHLLQRQANRAAVVRLDMRQWAAGTPSVANLPRVAPLLERGHTPGSTGMRQRWEQAPVSERATLLQAWVLQEMSQVLRTDVDTLAPGKPLKDLGIDSLLGMELRNRLEAKLGLQLAATLVYSHPTLAALCAHLMDKLGAAQQRVQGTVTPNDETPAPASAPATTEETKRA